MPDAAHMPASMDDTKIQCKADQRRQERKNHGKQMNSANRARSDASRKAINAIKTSHQPHHRNDDIGLSKLPDLKRHLSGHQIGG